ncbi:hypothetical protein BFW38_05575 [Terasakiispira papahanaumokuakeensis]|uniref:Uncharacterized protein n=1 Tax=Terasakiispira papahanaumokuakeensis TaxID=197479 RepID=A0A1E2V7Z9_9GAMM|nr:hypothetical protein [Terasakiispira papahanaumokuakeensis]ODC03094.1 hypothetical protein BFW38_05575 [Terasakiispira papahanaumokuakeensis]
MDIKGLNWGGMVSPSRGSIKDISNMPQRNQSDELPISNADVEKAPSIEPHFSSEKDLQPDPNDPFGDWFEGQGYIRLALPALTAGLQDSMESVEAQARQIVGDKEWDVSIDENNDLVIYGDDLTDDEREQLGALVHEAGVDQKMIQIRDRLIEAFDGVQRHPANNFRVDIFDNFTMDKTSFQQVFRLREHIENSDKNPFHYAEVIKGVQHLWGASDSLFDQIKKRGDGFDQSSEGYVVDVHA